MQWQRVALQQQILQVSLHGRHFSFSARRPDAAQRSAHLAEQTAYLCLGPGEKQPWAKLGVINANISCRREQMQRFLAAALELDTDTLLPELPPSESIPMLAGSCLAAQQ